MNSRKTLASAGLILALLLSTGVPASGSSGSPAYVQSTAIFVSSDGSVAINQTLVMPQNTTSVTIPLLSATVGDILALSQSGTPDSYQIAGANITIYTLGDSEVVLSYYTNSLTSKVGSVWTIQFDWNANSTLELPYQSTILSLSAEPLSSSEVEGSPLLLLGPGSWQVSYGLPIAVSQSGTSSSSTAISASSATSASSSARVTTSNATSAPSTSSTTTSTQAAGSGGVPYTSYLIIVVVVAAALAATSLLLRRRRGGTPGPSTLRPQDVEMLTFIRDRGGKVVEAEIRERFDVPRTSAWRQAKRLEQLGYLRVRKVGSQNQLELVRTDF